MSDNFTNPYASPSSDSQSPDEDQDQDLVSPIYPFEANQFAVVEEIPEQDRGSVITAWNRSIGMACGLMVLGLNFGSLGLLIFGSVLFFDDRWQWFLPGFEWIVFWMVLVGAIGFVVAIVVSQYYANYMENIYMSWQLGNAFRSRYGAIVDPDEPGQFYAGITPRENWQKMRLEPASDECLIVIDHKSQEVRIEGDFHRYRIPRNSLLSCEVEQFRHPISPDFGFGAVCLVLQTENGPHELIFTKGQTSLFEPHWNARRKQIAEELVAEILSLEESQGI